MGAPERKDRLRSTLFCLEFALLTFTIAPAVLTLWATSPSFVHLTFVRSAPSVQPYVRMLGGNPEREQQYIWEKEEDKYNWELRDSIGQFVVFPAMALSLCLGIALLVVSRIAKSSGDPDRAGLGYLIAGAAGLLWLLSSWLVLLPSLARAREKPVIYLYPKTEQMINVKLKYMGALTNTYPEYSSDGWNVLAKPSGELIDLKTGRRHYFLFWEGRDTQRYALSLGFVVPGESTSEFLEDKLATLGLSEREANEFIVYWLPRMKGNRFNVIHFATDEYNERVPLEVTPAPDTLIRVLMVFKAAERPISIEPQVLTPVVRRGFTVVEWGGTELK